MCAVVHPYSALGSVEQPDLMQDFEVVTNRRLGQVKRTRQITDTRFTTRV